MPRKKAKEAPKPIIHKGIDVDLCYPEIPDNWMPVDFYSSHRPLIYRIINNLKHDFFIEMGIGEGSTPLLKIHYIDFPKIECVSLETDSQWFEIFKTREYFELVPNCYKSDNHYLNYIENYIQWNIWGNAILFIDSAPGEQRKELISKHFATAKIIIVHDTEPEAEYVYNMDPILKTFRFRIDLIVEGMPQTTAVSNIYDFKNWKTVINDKIKFI